MFGFLLLIGLGVWVLFYRHSPAEPEDLPKKVSGRLDKIWEIAKVSLHEKKYLRAEKALLTILRVDERNVGAYNRLGILYAKQGAYDDAIECFEIAQSLEPSASSLHNVGLIYYETQRFDKAALAFEQALEMDDQHASRFVAYAKVQEKLGDNKKAIDALESAVKLEKNPQSLRILADAYERDGRHELAMKVHEKAAKMIIPSGKAKIIRQPRKVVM
ncbi:MAG: tetratricopeptide repeat protein [Candidatus Saccharibacteria bacterium]|nr:tetratricopeptide repeat protein [Candidatus Saccharibacteria bacterium]